MDVIHLRTLTRKSQMGFGQYYLLKVQEVFNLKRGSYIRWAYYNLSNISFTDDILSELGIFERLKINKPGTNPELFNKLINNIINNLSKIDRIKMEAKNKSHRKGQLAKVNIVVDAYNRKGRLKAKNQGNFR